MSATGVCASAKDVLKREILPYKTHQEHIVYQMTLSRIQAQEHLLLEGNNYLVPTPYIDQSLDNLPYALVSNCLLEFIERKNEF